MPGRSVWSPFGSIGDAARDGLRLRQLEQKVVPYPSLLCSICGIKTRLHPCHSHPGPPVEHALLAMRALQLQVDWAQQRPSGSVCMIVACRTNNCNTGHDTDELRRPPPQCPVPDSRRELGSLRIELRGSGEAWALVSG